MKLYFCRPNVLQFPRHLFKYYGIEAKSYGMIPRLEASLDSPLKRDKVSDTTYQTGPPFLTSKLLVQKISLH